MALGLASVSLALTVTACGGSGKTTTPTTTAPFGTLVDAGEHLLGTGNPQAAEQLFQQAIAKNPNNPVGHYDIGVVYQRLGDRRDALRQYNQALLHDRSYVPALYNEAILFTPGNAPLAIFYYRQIVRIQPNSPTAYLNLGLLENQTKASHRVALMDLKQAVRLDPASRAGLPQPLRSEVAAPLPPPVKPRHRKLR